MRPLSAALALTLAATPALAQRSEPAPTISPAALAALADSVAGQGSSLVRTRRLVHWINDGFTWSATDYQKRTPHEVIARRHGNCAELASVLHLLLESLELRSRWVREINVQPAPTPRRQATAESLVAKRGPRYSVFGLQHNDHVWLEVWDDSTGAWFPADPAYGVAGLDEWLRARLAPSDRPRPRVEAVVPIAADMLVPFVILTGDESAPFAEDRTAYYLIDQFDRLYDHRLSTLPAWSRWRELVVTLAPHARAAFEGRADLHEHTSLIAELKSTYDQLAREVR